MFVSIRDNKDGIHKEFCLFDKALFRYKKQIGDKKYYHNIPVNNKKIVFIPYYGDYTCNLKYIAEEIIRQNLPYELVWIANKNNDINSQNIPQNIKIVYKGTKEDFYEQATAKIWISNGRKNYYIGSGLYKRPEQKYIQTWHGSLGIKKTGDDLLYMRATTKHKLYRIDSSQFDYMISNSTYETNYFSSCFESNCQILEYGHARNDVFFLNDEDKQKIEQKVYSRLGIPSTTRIILYAPTFRTNNDLSYYNIDYSRVIKTLSEKSGKEWCVVLRLHPELEHGIDCNELKNVFNATSYPDMQELLVASDAVITDYSSCMFDFMLSGKPVYIYAADKEEYNTSRGFYYPLEETPFPIAVNNDELVKNILDFDNKKYTKGVKEFLAGKGCIDDGHASERVVDLIEEIIKSV